MKKRDISHWIKNEYFEGVMLFVQSFEEGSFNFSYESYRLPALNSHYLCYDIVYTARDIDRKVLMDGNFYPLAEEFEYMLKEDVYVKNFVSGNNTLLYSRDKNGDYYDLSTGDIKSKIRSYPEIAQCLIDFCETNNHYLESTYKLLLDSIFSNTYTQEIRSTIYTATRILITEYVNRGYSKTYIYSMVEDFFYNRSNTIECSRETIIDFLDKFTFEKKSYHAIFGINIKAADFFEKIENMEVREATPLEWKRLNLQKISDKVVVIEKDAVDVYSAFDTAFKYIETFLSFHRINQHDSKLFITPKAIVCEEKEDGSLAEGTLIRTAINPLKKKGNTSDLHALFGDVALFDKMKLPEAFYRAISMHSGAIENKDVSNQLLNLWTIIEILIDTKRDNEDKINTICAVLGAVLNRCYMYSNIEQLLHDIDTCSKGTTNVLFKQLPNSFSKYDKVAKLAIILSLPEYKELLEALISSLEDSPLLTYRIKQFSECILCDSQSIQKYLENHEKRVKWHIMRIYRNRNMIVHNGSYMSYRDIIIENLHYYVDVLIDTLIEHYNRGINTHASIYKNILNENTSYQVALGIPMNKKEKKECIPITADNAIELIFNRYCGNPIKKAIDAEVEQNTSKKRSEQSVETCEIKEPVHV